MSCHTQFRGPTCFSAAAIDLVRVMTRHLPDYLHSFHGSPVTMFSGLQGFFTRIRAILRHAISESAKRFYEKWGFITFLRPWTR